MPRALINIHTLLQDFNPNKFIVYFSTLIFTILLSLRLDNKITISYWLVFLPLWIWKSIALLGAFVGSIIWLRNPDYRVSNSSYVHFKSMLISISLQLLLVMFEILVCDKLETRRNTWILTFTPLIFISLLSISVCVWSVKNGREIELEFFAAINILQFVLIALKLDNIINWSWMVVFVPSWILLCSAAVVILYAMIFAAIVLRSPEIGTEQRRASIHSASSSSMTFLPMLMFIILLTSKLDSPPYVLTPSYFFICLPLFLTLIILIRLSFGSKSGSLWWFGMRADFCTYLLTICPCLKEYGNTSYIMSHRFSDTVADSAASTTGTLNDNANSPSNNYSIQVNNFQQQQQQSDYSDNGSQFQEQHHEGNAKRLLHSLSQVFFRSKTNQQKGDEMPPGPVVAKLNIDSPD